MSNTTKITDKTPLSNIQNVDNVVVTSGGGVDIINKDTMAVSLVQHGLTNLDSPQAIGTDDQTIAQFRSTLAAMVSNGKTHVYGVISYYIYDNFGNDDFVIPGLFRGVIDIDMRRIGPTLFKFIIFARDASRYAELIGNSDKWLLVNRVVNA